MSSKTDLRANLAALSDKSVLRLIGADFTSVLGTGMVLAALPLAVLSLGGTGFDVGLVLAAQAAGIVPGLVIGGALGDRLDRRQVLVAADLLRLFSQGVIAVLIVLGDASLWQLVAAQLVHGFGTGVFTPASSAIVPDLVPERLVQPTNAVKQIGRAVASIGGPALGALACAVANPGLALAGDAATFGVSALLLHGMTVVRRQRADSRSLVADLHEGLTTFMEMPWLRSVTLQFAVINALVLAPFYVLGPIAAQDRFGGVSAWAVMVGTLAAGEFAGGAIAMTWRPRRPLLAATIAFPAFSGILVAVALAAPLPVIFAGALVAGIALAIFAVLFETTVQTQIVDPQMRARVMSCDEIGALGTVPLGFLVGGVFAETIGTSAALLAGTGILLVSAALVLLSPSVRGLRGPTATGPSKDQSAEHKVAPPPSSGPIPAALAEAPGGTA
jgi:MFS family permease